MKIVRETWFGWLIPAGVCLALASCGGAAQEPAASAAPMAAEAPGPADQAVPDQAAALFADGQEGGLGQGEVEAATAEPPAPVPAPVVVAAVTAPPAAARPAAPPPKPPPPKPPPAPAETWAQVVSVTPIRQSIDHPEEICHDVEVERQVEAKDDKQIAGAAIGAILGAVVGGQVGDGKGRKAARVVGAVAGAAAGRKIQENQQGKRTEVYVEEQCETVNEVEYRTVGYEVVYSHAGETHRATVAEDPGDRIRLPVRSIDLANPGSGH